MSAPGTAKKPKTLVVGFDGFIDSIARPLRQTAGEGKAAEYYPDIASLGAALQGQAGKSCSIELDLLEQKAGGNAPLLAGGAAALGMDVSVIGMLGQGGPLPIFTKALAARLYSYAGPGASTALEFADGKVFLAPGVKLVAPAWELIEAATQGQAAAMLQNADALAIVNWSELGFAGQLWQDVFERALQPAPADKTRAVLFDLCDCSRKGAGETDAVLRLIGRYGARRRTLLSLNENEAEVLARHVLGRPAPGGTPAAHAATAEALRDTYNIDAVMVHTRGAYFYATGRGLFTLSGPVIARPRISTGAGDHLNAALCCALANGLDEDATLRFADAFARRYLATGRAPTLAEMHGW